VRLDRQITFCVEAQRAVVQIAGAHSQESIVYNHQLGVNGNRHIVLRKRGKGLKATISIGQMKPVYKIISGMIHAQAVECPAAVQGADDDDFGTIRLSQAPGEGSFDHW
jgi:hypothetical protein